MKRFRFNKVLLFFLLGIFLQSNSVFSQSLKFNYFQTLPQISIRALEILNDSTIWFAANQGVFGYTENQGKTWHIDSIKADSIYPEFRSISILDNSTILLLSIGTPAYLFKTIDKGLTWQLAYTNRQEAIFFDCMKFKNSEEGIAIADPIDGCFKIIKTKDAGEHWTEIDCKNIPAALDGEACFAASNSCIDIVKENVWFATGGKHSRVFFSKDFGNHFVVFENPIQQGETMTGIFSVDFLDKDFGVVAGGNYDKTDTSIVAIATTKNGGRTWNEIKTATSFFGSCVQVIDAPSKKKSNTNRLIITGHDGTYLLNSDGTQLKHIIGSLNEELKFNAVRCINKSFWFAGSNGLLLQIETE